MDLADDLTAHRLSEADYDAIERIAKMIDTKTPGTFNLGDVRDLVEANHGGLNGYQRCITYEEVLAGLSDVGIELRPVDGIPDAYHGRLKRPESMLNPHTAQHAKHEWLASICNVVPIRPGIASAPPMPATPDTAVRLPRVPLHERALRVGGKDVTRIKTGFPSIDTATRGGILLSKVVVFGGAPGAGKTALLVKQAYACLSQGIAVGILAADEDADALLIRLGQLHGLSREALENGDPTARKALAAWCSSVPLLLVDGDEQGATVESVSAELRVKAAGKPSLFGADSIQTARTATPLPKGADLRARTNATVAALKRAAKVDGHLVIATSELSKAAYRNRAQAENVSALSAFKESGDIEYGVALAIVLTSRQGTSDLVDAAIVKNRLGPGKPEFMLRLDHERASVFEIDRGTVTAVDPLAFTKDEIVEVVRKAAGAPLRRGFIAGKVGGRKAVALRAITELVDARILHEETRGIRMPLPGEPGYEPT